MKRIALFFILCSFLIGTAQSQPAKRRTTTTNAAAQKGQQVEQKTDRASLMFPTSAEMPEDVVWRRDIYRQLDLMADKNAPLYYPVEPTDRQVNLFTYLFRLFLTKRIPVYTYKLDGNESFAEKDRVTDVKEILDRYYIYYEEDNGKYTVADNDVPSAQVKRYYIKESSYFDQRTGTYRSKVTALCPVLIEDDFGDGGAAPKPLFWIKYDDVAPYLSRLPIMASNLNNVTNMTADDYFTMNHYDGKIYKTANMQGRVLANETDTAKVKKEQQRIEQQLVDFEQNIWHQREKVDTLTDSVAVEEPKAKVDRRQRPAATPTAKAKETTVSKGTTRRSQPVSGTEKKQKQRSSASSSSTPTASARRVRR
ncbi:MAG: gliding motility protein GldN [Bacteroidaceae bacterium]|nr:gliding motility protein GldN [Bacteroidaceae bacterium]